MDIIANRPGPAKKGKCPEVDNILSMSEISISLDSYDDIFSDFDPRSYSQRSLSEDFLTEAKRASRDKNYGKLELRFMLPAERRRPDLEAVIKKRLHDHFKRHHDMLERERWEIIKKGIMYTIIGVFLLLIDTIIYPFHNENFLTRFIYIIIEPAGWFTAWTGLDQIYYTSRENKTDLEFYKKMSKSEIKFYGY